MAELVYVDNKPKLKLKKPTKRKHIPYYAIEDCKKIKKAIESYKLEITLGQCYDLYHAYSEYQYCSGWTSGISVLEEKSIVIMLEGFLKKLEWIE
ncbi:hypothetical protein [Alkaliphilus sp. B6464]|uniref:hypothetical protein n=1 Tax=Alkaliphilus sp. B6464 TaxID=2731219 RepID=UPI001BA89B71|nr:hypothetical protein [Alkaliphilus sp. B6464]QUH22177.1 hypothetical protein HYG84_19915 [Alkaliphilus sp. B6464]